MKNETRDREVKFTDVLKLFKHLESCSLFRAGAWIFYVSLVSSLLFDAFESCL